MPAESIQGEVGSRRYVNPQPAGLGGNKSIVRATAVSESLNVREGGVDRGFGRDMHSRMKYVYLRINCSFESEFFRTRGREKFGRIL